MFVKFLHLQAYLIQHNLLLGQLAYHQISAALIFLFRFEGSWKINDI